MRRSTLLITAAGLLALAHPAPAHAQKGSLGIGLIAGDPTGLTLKFPLAGNTAIDLAVGANAIDNNDDGQLHADWLIAPAVLARGNGVTIPLYLGLGGLIEFDNRGRNDDIDLGLRAPVGLAFELQRMPLEFFVELGLELLIIDEGNNDDVLDIDGALGVRFYL
jgi:hypothetical protein